MGIRQISLIIFTLILFSSFACAVPFEWALGDSSTKNAYGDYRYDIGTAYHNLAPVGPYGPNPAEPRMIVINLYHSLDVPSGGCGATQSTWVNYKGNNLETQTWVKGNQDFTDEYYLIADSVQYSFTTNYCYHWCEPFGCCNRCWVRGHFLANYVQVSASGVSSVFKEDQVKSIGSVRDLMGRHLVPDGETVYLGVDTPDIMYWIGKKGEDYTGQKEIIDPDFDDYVNVCADVNRNGVCDYLDAEPCFDQGADWYGDTDWVQGVCCGADRVQLKKDTGLESTNCTKELYRGKAYCGINLNGNYEWAPLNDVGAVHELLSCPGYSLVSDGNRFIDCKLSATEAKFFKLSGTLNTHGYLCSAGELFECRGDGAAYSGNPDFVADTGVSTNDLVGSGGCPPKIVAYWNFDDGTARDYVGTYTGALTGGSSIAGKISGAVHLELGDKITLPASVPVEGSQFTVEAWIRPSETSGLRKIIEKEGSFRIAVDGGLLVGALRTNRQMIDFGSRRLVPNVWHHVALVYDGDKASLYLNGVAVSDPAHSGDVVWSDKPVIVGGNFVGDIDEIAVYNRALRSALIKRHAKMPAGYCAGADAGLSENYYCAGDAEWTSDLDSKDASSCNNAGFVWTGNFCCSEDDDANEYYNDYDTPPADLAKVANGGQTVSAHAGAQVSSAQIILTNKGQFAAVQGPAKLVVETYSAESPSDIGACPPAGVPEIIVVSPWEQKTLKISSIGQSGDPCRYRHKIITAAPFLALGGCWDKEFIPIGHFVDSKNIINYRGHFYSCGLSQNAPGLQIKDFHTGGILVSPASMSCSDIKLNARGAGLHVVCNPGGMWQFTNDSAATASAEVAWLIAGTNASRHGCCRPDQCWSGFGCVDAGQYYSDPVSGNSYFCEE